MVITQACTTQNGILWWDFVPCKVQRVEVFEILNWVTANTEHFIVAISMMFWALAFFLPFLKFLLGHNAKCIANSFSDNCDVFGLVGHEIDDETQIIIAKTNTNIKKSLSGVKEH